MKIYRVIVLVAVIMKYLMPTRARVVQVTGSETLVNRVSSKWLQVTDCDCEYIE
jgi:hypothetical protein